MQSILQVYAEFKLMLGRDYGLTEDLLHVHAGLIIFFLAAILSRQRIRSPVPIVIVYALAIMNEMVDLLTPGKSAGAFEPVADILNTVVWPSLLFLLARRRISRERTSGGNESPVADPPPA
ncbi:hypothetical protein [Pseudopontixanthobacter vadosimaris]|uniref:hypothetical protein n=1 Tax=Pseudopontixanthobacter vadosimaris TaxID=2726450 RepID=UPI001472F27A|nr:hypothetical protein [Pseudopontixanthobacter vadosimaris]